MRISLPIFLAFAAGCAASAFAQSLTAELSSAETRVGMPVELVISASGSSQARLLDDLEVDGLRVVGKSDQLQMQMSFPGGMQVTTRTVLTLLPEREGEFRIPPLRVQMNRQVMQTPECVLKVLPGGGGLPTLPAIPVPQGGGQGLPGVGSGSPGTSADSGGPAQVFGEIVLAKTTSYVGEVVPAELRFFVDARIPAQFGQRVQFGGEGFTVQRTGEPTRATRQEGSTVYQSVAFPTAITAAKSGEVEIPPASLPAQVQVPGDVPGGMQDLFGGLFNFGFTEAREIEIRTQPAKLEVRPLPTQGQPPHFSGAIGDFRLAVEATPRKAEPGDPITLKVRISGRGNFEAMGPPVLEETEGWRVYDPAESFQPSPGDPIGYIGEKTFEFTLIARRDQRSTPPVKFSFFNPETGEYQTLEGPPVAIDAKGQAAQAAAPPASSASPSSSPAEDSSQGSVAGEGSELSRDFAPRSFRPAAWAPGFVFSGIVLGLVWLAAAAALILRQQAMSPAAERKARRRELRAELQRLASSDLPDDEFLDRAARLARERVGGQSLSLPPEILEGIEELYAREAEAKFSSRGTALLGMEARTRMLSALRALDRALPALVAIGYVLLSGNALGVPVEEAMESYARGDFARAAREFETALAAQPPSAGLEYNLGMALKRDGQPGPAALHFLRALALNPRMADAKIALSDLERAQGIPFQQPGWQERLGEHVSIPGLLVAGFALFWLGAFCALGLLWRPSIPLAVIGMMMLGLGAGIFTAAYLADPRFAWRREAVALQGTTLLSSPAERSETVARLAAGARARVVNRSGEWMALQLSDGRRGWAPASAFQPIMPDSI